MPSYQEKNKKKWTKDGRSWYFRCYYTDVFGNRKQYESPKYYTKKEANEEEHKFLTKYNHHEIVEDPLFDDVFKEWLDYKKFQVKSSTYYDLMKKLEKHILPFFTESKLSSINASRILLWKEELSKTKLILDSQNTIIRYFKEILEYAEINYNFDKRIISKLQTYKIETIVETGKKSQNNFWTFDEFQKFISVIDNSYFYLVCNFLYYTGVRFGELMALTWDDVDFDKNIVKINKTLSCKVGNGSYIITSPKTSNSVRYVLLNDVLLKLLRKHYEEEKKLYAFDNKLFVFGNVKHLSQTTFRRFLDTHIALADVKKITIHGFRHSHVSLLINLGCDVRDVAERIGDTVQMVENTYYHMFPQKKNNVLDKLNSLNSKE